MQERLFETDTDVLPGKKLLGSVAGTFVASSDHFVTRAAEALPLDFEGIVGDYHRGHTRRSGGREPWYTRGTEMRNERQLSIVAPDELSRIARNMGLGEVRCEWIGANLLIEGIPMLSMLPAGTLLFFAGGVTLKVDGQNAPCRTAGACVAEKARMDDVQAGSIAFVKAAKRLRGLVGWVEKPGTIRPGEAVSVRIPEQWIYRP